jgi:hypothetical protein
VRQPNEGTHRLVGKIDQRKPIGQRDEHRAAVRWRRRAHHRVEANRTIVSAVENVQFAAFDVHPQQAPCRGVPPWSFRELRIGAYGDLHRGRIAGS